MTYKSPLSKTHAFFHILVVCAVFLIIFLFQDKIQASGVYTADNSLAITGLSDSASSDIALDTVNHRLFVSQPLKNRVLVYNLDSSNIPLDATADHVLGQVNLVDVTVNAGLGSINAGGLDQPINLAYDGVRDYLFVADYGNSRVLVFDTGTILDGEDAIFVLGQDNFVTDSRTQDQSHIDGPSGLAYDSNHERLFVLDNGSSTGGRMLVFDARSPGVPVEMCDETTSGLADGMNASCLYGQVDFDTFTADDLFFASIDLDVSSSRLFVTNTIYNSVSVLDIPESEFDTFASFNTLSGSFTLGNYDSPGADPETTQDSLGYPTSSIYDSVRDQIFVSDSSNNRIIVYDTTPGVLATGELARNVLGQSDFISASTGVGNVDFDNPNALEFDPTNNFLYVADINNDRILIFDLIKFSTATTSITETVGTPYSQLFDTTQDQGTVTYELYSGSLPPGITLNATLGISGTPTTAGSYSFVIRAKDTLGPGDFISNSQSFNVTINSAPSGTSGGSSGGGVILTDICPDIPGTQTSIANCPPPAPTDYCPDIPGVQNSISECPPIIPTDFCPDMAGIQTSITECPIILAQTDYCPNMPGVQTSISQCPPVIPTDVCPDIPGTQTSIANCPPPAPTDYCPDIPGVQNSISECPPPPTEETCATNPSLCPPPIETCATNPALCPPPPDCPPDIFNSALCIVIDSYEYVEGIIIDTAGSIKDIMNNPTSDIITKLIGIVGLVFSAIFVALPVLFSNPLSFSEIFLIPARIWSLLLIAFGLKKRNRPWGTVYDSVTKQPLDPAYISLQDTEGKEIAGSITDISGRYGFLVPPGKYRILPKKTHYTFPSLKLVGKTRDEVYLDLYFGYVFEIKKEGEVITKNIPMDPENFDWNEFAKGEQHLVKYYTKRERIMIRVADISFSVGFTVATIALIAGPTTYNISIFLLYLLMLVFKEAGIKRSSYGLVIQKGTDLPVPYAIVRILSATGVEVMHRITDVVGKYYALVTNGNYTVTIEIKNADGTYTKVFEKPNVEVMSGLLKERFEIELPKGPSI